MPDNDKALALTPRTIQEGLALADQLVKSGLLPAHVKTAQQVFALITMGAELGVGTWAAILGISVIQGKPTPSPQLMLALIHRSKLLENFEMPEHTAERCTIVVTRRGQSPVTFTFTMEDAAALGLAGKDNYKKQPATMLQWRCISAMARVVFPDVLHGFSYTPEEIDPDLAVDENGAVVVAEAVVSDMDYSEVTPAEREAELEPGMIAPPGDDDEERGPLAAAFATYVAEYEADPTKFSAPTVTESAITHEEFIGADIFPRELGDTFFNQIGKCRTAAIRDARLIFVSALAETPINSYKELTDAQRYALAKAYKGLGERGTLKAAIEAALEGKAI